MSGQIALECNTGLRRIAGKMCLGNPGTFDDLLQEMRLELLTMPEGQDLGYYFRAAKNRAIDYLQSNKCNYTYKDKFKHFSLESMVDSGFQIDTNGNVWETKGEQQKCDT